MDGFEKVTIGEPIEVVVEETSSSKSTQIVDLLRKFLNVQKRIAEAYANLRSGFNDYMGGGTEAGYQQVCREITEEFNECSKQVLKLEALFLNAGCCRDDLASLLRSVQAHEKQKLQLTVTIQLLKKSGRPSERLVSHENCRFGTPAVHECMHVHDLTVADGTEDAEADAEYDGALKEAIRGVQDAVTSINEHLEEVRYEIEALEAET
ncbi:hypothetical protein MKX01_032779 [Papaver californicum]|nr:hypothetical protein MKX01_032779 [Papaver californicum]